MSHYPYRFMRVISKEDLANLPIRRYEGRISLVQSSQELAEAREDLRQERVVGLDTETRPSFRKGETYLPCLVQAATAREVSDPLAYAARSGSSRRMFGMRKRRFRPARSVIFVPLGDHAGRCLRHHTGVCP